MVYIICYKINPSSKDYTPLFEKIKSLGTWMHYIDDLWFLEPHSLDDARAIYDRLIPYIDGDKDYIFVAPLTNQVMAGWLPKDAWTWLKERNL